MTQSIYNAMASQAIISNHGKSGKGSAASGAGLGSLAAVLGELLDKRVEGLKNFASTLPDDPTPSQSTQLQVLTQEFSVLMNAVDNAIKTIGEGEKNSASKN